MASDYVDYAAVDVNGETFVCIAPAFSGISVGQLVEVAIGDPETSDVGQVLGVITTQKTTDTAMFLRAILEKKIIGRVIGSYIFHEI